MIPQLLEEQPFAQAQLGNHVGYQNLIGFGVRTEPSRQLNSGAEKIVLALDRLTGRDANSDPERIFLAFLLISGQSAQNPDRAANRGGCRNKGGHDAISGMLDLTAVQSCQGLSDDTVMNVQQSHRGFVAQGFIGGTY